MAKLETGDGIRCDLCQATHTKQFQYYSYDLIACQVYGGLAPSTLQTSRQSPVMSSDLCEACHQKIAQLVIAVNAKPPPARGLAICELTSKLITDGPAVLVYVTSVSVNLMTKNVATDVNCLSFLISNEARTQLEAKPQAITTDTWDTKS